MFCAFGGENLELGGEFVGEQGGVVVGEFGADDLLVADEELGEEGLVPLSAGGVVGDAVGQFGVGGEAQRFVEGASELVDPPLGVGKLLLGCGQFACDAGLFFAEQLGIEFVGVVELEQLAALAFERFDAAAVAGEVAFALGDDGLQRHGEVVAELGDALGGQTDGLAVVVGDGGFGVGGGEVGLGAAVLVVVAAGTHEVLVCAAVAAGAGEEEAPAAVAAVDGAFEVVGVLAVLLAGGAVGGEHGLDAREDVGWDKSLVGALVVDAAVADDADVVGVGEHPGEAGASERPGRLGPGRSGGQAALMQRFGEGVQGVGAGGVGAEGPAHRLGAFGVEFDGAHFTAVLPLADVAVAERGELGGAAVLGFLHGAFEDFGGEVARVELGD